MVLREPTDRHRAARDGRAVGDDVGVAYDHALGIAGGTGGVLQEEHRPGCIRHGGAAKVLHVVRREPAQLRWPLGVRPGQRALSVAEQQAVVGLELLGRQHRLGLAVPRDEAELGQPRLERHGQRGADRYGDDPDARAGVERGHHLQTGRINQQRSIPRPEPGLCGQVGGQLARPLVETLVGVTLELPAIGIDEPEERLVRSTRFPHPQVIDKRLHRGNHSPSKSVVGLDETNTTTGYIAIPLR